MAEAPAEDELTPPLPDVASDPACAPATSLGVVLAASGFCEQAKAAEQPSEIVATIVRADLTALFVALRTLRDHRFRLDFGPGSSSSRAFARRAES
jgi:hypothetical protein